VNESLWVPAALLAAAVALAAILFFWWKGLPFAEGDVFRASRWSSGNHLFPTQVRVTPTSVVHYTPEWVGRKEQSIHIAHISSVGIDTNMFFSNVVIETSGGAEPVRCHGHLKRDAVHIKHLIEQYQTQYFRQPVAPGASIGRPEVTRG
jgi:hypothetical protein